MKKIMILAATLAALASCSKQAARKDFHLTGFPEFDISYDGGTASFGIEANPEDAWSLLSDADWFKVTQGFGNGNGANGKGDAVFNVACDRWTKNSIRKGTITVTGPTGVFTKTLTQSPKPVPSTPLLLQGSISYTGNESRIDLPDGYWVTAKCDAGWLTVVECREGELTVKAEPNPSVDAPRTAPILILLSDGAQLAEVTVTQHAEKKPVPVD